MLSSRDLESNPSRVWEGAMKRNVDLDILEGGMEWVMRDLEGFGFGLNLWYTAV